MPKKTKFRTKIPAYRQRKGYAQAIVTLTDSATRRRRDYWLGEHDTPESREAYHRVIAAWEANGRRWPDLPSEHSNGVLAGLAITEVTREYWRWAIRAFRIADNKLHELSGWDLEMLAVELKDLQALDFNLNAMGFSAVELAELLDGGIRDGLCDPDEVPAPPDEATTKPGDIWLLGDHRLM